MTQGIYLIENLINQKKYIGQSTHIESRFNAHKNHYKAHLESSPLLYRAFEKYGLENFKFSILEKVENKQDLNEKESYYILKLNTLSPNGYNCVLPTELMRWENNVKNKLSNEDIENIKNILINTEVPINEIAAQYSVELSTIYRINRGETWTTPDTDYPLRKTNDLARPGNANGRSNFTDEEVMEIRKAYVNKTVNELYKDYQDKCSLSGFKKIVQGETFSHLPIYKKSIKTWVKL